MNGAKDPSRIHPALFYSSEIHFRAGEVGQAEVFDQLLNALSTLNLTGLKDLSGLITPALLPPSPAPRSAVAPWSLAVLRNIPHPARFGDNSWRVVET